MNKLFLTVFLLLQSAVIEATPTADSPARNTPSAAQQNHARIKIAVTDFVRRQTASLPGKVTYQVNEIDRRLVTPQCTELEAFLPAGSQLIGKTSIGVRCNTSAGITGASDRSARWSIFVPVQIRLNLNLLTSARQLPPGHTLQAQDLTTQATESSRTDGLTDPGQVIGKVLRYGIAAGQVLREDMLRQPYSVTQGQVVPLTVRGNGFSIRSEGTALNNAGEGQTLQVRVGSGRVIGGMARADGTVEIAP